MNSNSPLRFARSSLSSGLAVVAVALCGCSTPHGYGVDERAMRTPDGSSGVVAGATTPNGNAPSPAMQNQSTYLSLITEMQHEGQYFASLAHLDSYETRFGRSPESILLRGDAERLTDQPELAARSYALLQDTPLAGPGYRGLSLLAGARGDFAAAAKLLEEALRFNSTDAVALSDLGYARLRLGDTSAARVPLMTAAQLAPGNPKVMSNLALYLILDHDSTQAEAVLKSAGVSAQTRHAIYAQAGQMSHDSVGEAPQAALHTAAVASKTSAGQRSDTASVLRIDFALANPAAGSPVDPIVASTQR